MITKYNLEKEVINNRNILDSPTKVSFRTHYPLSFSYSSDTGLYNVVYVDLTKSNYFYLDLDLYPEDANFANIFITPVNYTSNQRFELLIKSGGDTAISLLFIEDNCYFVFPWGYSDPPVNFNENYATYSIISFRVGLITSTKREYIGIQSKEWINI